MKTDLWEFATRYDSNRPALFEKLASRASVKPTYGVNYVLKSLRYAKNEDQMRVTNFQLSALYAENQSA